MKDLAQYIYNYQNTDERMSREAGKISAILKDKHLECVSRSLMMGLATGVLTFSALYFGQRRFTSQIKGMKRSNIILSSTFFACTTGRFSRRLVRSKILISLFSGYLIVDAKLTECYKNLRRKVQNES